MSTPGQPGPDGAWQLGSRFGQDLDENAVDDAITAGPRADLMKAVGGFNLFRQKQFDTSVDHEDGQNSIRDRIEFLRNVSGYASSYMTRNWKVPQKKWVIVPFPGQVGPAKNAVIDSVAGRLVLKAGGVWQVYLVANDWSYNWYYTPGFNNGGISIPGYTTYYACAVAYVIEVVSAQGELLGSCRFDAQTAGGVKSVDVNRTKAGSVAFTCTVTLDDMPPPDAPGASNHWAYVRVSMYVEPRQTLLSGFSSAIYGGTKKSALTAIRWTHESADTVNVPTVPDGGTVT